MILTLSSIQVPLDIVNRSDGRGEPELLECLAYHPHSMFLAKSYERRKPLSATPVLKWQ